MSTRRHEPNPIVSIIIPGHNRPASLRETLAALRNQTISPKKYEVILIGFTGTSLKETADEGLRLAKHPFMYKEISTRWPDAKRNEGIRLARGEIIAFTDDDVIPAHDWVESFVKSFKRNPAAVGIEGYTDGDNTPLLSHATKNHAGGEYPACNIGFRRDLVKERGVRFDEAYHFFREDTDIAYQALRFGPIVFDSSVKIFHPTRAITPRSILNELGMIRGEIRLARKFPKSYSAKYGTIGRGGWIQSIFSWTVFVVAGMGAYLLSWMAIPAGIAILFLFRWIVSFRRRSSTFMEKIRVWFFTLLRDLAYPFFFSYFWFFIEKSKSVE